MASQGDRNSWYCMVDEAGRIQLEQRVRTSGKALQGVFDETTISLKTPGQRSQGRIAKPLFNRSGGWLTQALLLA